MKKLDNLGSNEFAYKNKILNIQKNNILLVDNPNIASSSVVEALKGKVSIIVHKKPVSRKMEEELPFVFIEAGKLAIEEDKYFGFMDRKRFEMEKSKSNWIRKLVDEYRKEQLIPR